MGAGTDPEQPAVRTLCDRLPTSAEGAQLDGCASSNSTDSLWGHALTCKTDGRILAQMRTQRFVWTGRIAILSALLTAVTGCASGSPSSALPSEAASPTQVASPTASLVPTATPVPTLPADAAPAELKGHWTTEMGPGDEVLLIINDNGYSTQQGGLAINGHISVTGDQIAFSRVQSCPGTGTYRWAIDADGILTFAAVGDPDPCPRVSFLDGHAYARK